MNHIEVKYIKTCYDYYEYYWVIDGEPITVYLDRNNTGSLSAFGSLLGLLPAWSGELIWQWENDFIWEMADSREELNVPVLVCEDDCDLSCIVIVAHIRKEKNAVYWDRIGVLDKSNISAQDYGQSGILCLEAYTDEDWEKYGGNIALEEYGSSEYWKWVSENSYEEHIRRLRNYFKPYMQNGQNVEWIWETGWQFEREEYEIMAERYREIAINRER